APSYGRDLERLPLAVSECRATRPIEVSVRDDGAAVEGAIVGASTRDAAGAGFRSQAQSPGNIYFCPTTGSSGQFRMAWVSPDGTFQLQQLPPGDYRGLACVRSQHDLDIV